MILQQQNCNISFNQLHPMQRWTPAHLNTGGGAKPEATFCGLFRFFILNETLELNGPVVASPSHTLMNRIKCEAPVACTHLYEHDELLATT